MSVASSSRRSPGVRRNPEESRQADVAGRHPAAAGSQEASQFGATTTATVLLTCHVFQCGSPVTSVPMHTTAKGALSQH